MNFQGHDEGEDRLRAAYGANLDRLVEVKQRYDPDSLFRVARNVAPLRRQAPALVGQAARPAG